jgi:general secretion pathway protein J
MLRRSFFNRVRMRDAHGFTLVEVMVAISVLAIVLLSVYGVFASVNAAKVRLDSDSDEYHMARVIFDRLGRELHGTYYRSDDNTTMFRGGVNDNGQPYLELTTTAVTPLSATGIGISEVRYRLEQEMETTGDDKQVLLRSERPRQSKKATVNGRMMRMAPGVESFALRFYTGRVWEDKWDAGRDGLPQLIEISLVVSGVGKRQIPFRTTFDIPDVSL